MKEECEYCHKVSEFVKKDNCKVCPHCYWTREL
jgi:hypothetical protein